MNSLTINPLLTLVTCTKRSQFKIGDLEQIENKIKNTIKKKLRNEKQKHSIIKDEKYLEILLEIKEYFLKKQIITSAELIAKTNEILKNYNFYYQKKQHRPVNKNVFWGDDCENKPIARNYDIAFYNKLFYPTEDYSHHNRVTQKATYPSVFFMRVEAHHQEDKMLIGNMQLDYKRPELWDDSITGKIMLNSKNIELMMVQEALKHAISKNCANILFQAGRAAILAQFDHSGDFSNVLVTALTYKSLIDSYNNNLNKFASLQIGDFLGDKEYKNTVVYKKEPDKIYCYQPASRTYNNFFDTLYLSSQGIPKNIKDTKHELMKELMDKNLDKILMHINIFLQQIDSKIDLSPKHAAKIKFLRQICQLSTDASYFSFCEFFDEFGYTAKLLNEFPHIHRYVNQNDGKCFYINSLLEDKKLFLEFEKNDLIKPVIGKEVVVANQQDKGSYFPDLVMLREDMYKIFIWYEYKIPKLLKKLGVGVEKEPIATRINDKPSYAYAWKITSGLDDFEKKPMIVF